MCPETPPTTTALINGLSERLRRVLLGDSRRFALAANSALTIDIYLAALYRSFPDEVSNFLSPRQTLAKLSEDVSSIDVGLREIVSAAPSSSDAHTILLSRIDKNLLSLLWRAAKVSAASGRGPADLADLMGALSIDDETVARLERDRGLFLKGYLGPEPPSP